MDVVDETQFIYDCSDWDEILCDVDQNPDDLYDYGCNTDILELQCEIGYSCRGSGNSNTGCCYVTNPTEADT